MYKLPYNVDRPLSWSALSSFEWNREQWYAKYISGEKTEITPELAFGSKIDKQLQDDPSFLPDVVRYPVMQHGMRSELNGIPLIGYADAYDPAIPALRDYKTGKNPWDQKRTDETGQLTMYALLLWLTDKVRPDDVEFYIDWLPTHIENKVVAFIEPVRVQTFKTKRSMAQVLSFGRKIGATYKEMERYAESRSKLDVSDYKDW